MKQAEYEKALFEAYIATPGKFEWYKKAFDYFSQREGKLSWYWNSWAFLGGFWYFLYRKQMKMAMIVLFTLLVMAVIVPAHILIALFLFLSLLVGGFGSYFVYTNYLERKKEIEAIIPEREKRISIMRSQVGGVNRWAIPVALFALLSLVLIIVGLTRMAAVAAG
jgi:hypothetical protein